MTTSTYWASDENLRHILTNHAEFTVAMNTLETKLFHWTFDDFKKFYEKQRYYFFRPLQTYHNVKNSILYAEKGIKNQIQHGKIKDGCNNPQYHYGIKCFYKLTYASR